MFVDIVKIFIKAGRGGDGAVSFHREKYVAAGGPDGGDGGKGGNVVFAVDNHMSSLMDFRLKCKYIAENGENGRSKKCFGRDGKDIVIKVPKGTLIKESESGALIKDMSDNEPFVCAKGGNGGFGNAHFATPTRQVPRFAKPGLPGEELNITLELKLLADVGLIGFPNVGKSTLLSVVSSARPKIANYHFTTLKPNLGVVYVDEGSSFVMADIPGLIEGAKDGAGLGHHFLRHVERCRLLVHIVDVSGIEGRDPIEDFETIMGELSSYSEMLSKRKQIVAANKTDIIQDEKAAIRFEEYIREKGYEFFRICAATGENVKTLVNKIALELEKLPPVLIFEPEYVPEAVVEGGSKEISIVREDDVFIVEGKWLYKAMRSVNFDDYESRMYFERVMRKAGVFDRLREMDIKEGDTVSIYDLEFEYIE